MGNTLIAWTNAVKSSTLTATSAEPALPVTNLTGDQGSPSTGWQTLAGALSPTLTITPPARTTVRAVGLFRTNLTASASVNINVYAQPLDDALDLNFIDGSALNPALAFARSTVANYFNAGGTLTQAAINGPRIDYGPVPGAAPLGLLIEESRTNGVRNPRAEGAVPGTPGTFPTNWSTLNTSGLTFNVIGRSSESGIPYVDIQIVGTSTNNVVRISAETSTAIVGVQGQTWTSSSYLRLVGGSLANITSVAHAFSANTAAGALLTLYSGSAVVPTGASLASQRNNVTATIADATAGCVQGDIISMALSGTGVAINVTLRIGAPQLEQGGSASSTILPAVSSPAATTRAADLATMPTASIPGFSGTTLSLVADAMIPKIISTAQNGAAVLDDGTIANRVIIRISTGFFSGAEVVASATTTQPSTGTQPTSGTPFKFGAAVDPAKMIIAANGGAATTGAGATPTGLTTLRLGQNNSGGNLLNGYLSRLRYWSRALSAAELALATDPQNGAQAFTLTPVNGQVVAVLAADSPADYITITISDPTNPDNHINVPLVFAGPAWQPLTAMSWASSMGRDQVSDVVTTRGGQTYVDLRASFRRWEIALDGVRDTEAYTQLDPLDRFCRAGSNVLLCPNILSAGLQYEATFGILKPTADVTFPLGVGARRSWRASLSERL